MTNNITSLLTSLASDLQFVEIVDRLDYNWVEWMVEFTYEGIEYTGELQACPFHPTLMQDTSINAIEKK